MKKNKFVIKPIGWFIIGCIVLTIATAVGAYFCKPYCDNYFSNLLIGLSTGCFTSTLVSAGFVIIQKIKENSNHAKDRKKVTDTIKLFFYRFIRSTQLTKVKKGRQDAFTYMQDQIDYLNDLIEKAKKTGSGSFGTLASNFCDIFEKGRFMYNACFKLDDTWKKGCLNKAETNLVGKIVVMFGIIDDFKTTGSAFNQVYAYFCGYSLILEACKTIPEFNDINQIYFYEENGETKIDEEEFKKKNNI